MTDKEIVPPAENGDEEEPKEVKVSDENHHKNPQVDYNLGNPYNQGCRGGLTTRDSRKPYH